MTNNELNNILISMNGATSINLIRRNLGNAEVTAITHALENNTTLTSIELSCNQISDVGAKAIALALELKADAILMDERAGSGQATRVGLLILPKLTIL